MKISSLDTARNATTEKVANKKKLADEKRQLQGLANLLLLNSRLRKADNLNSLGLIAVNDTRLLVPYESAFLWLKKPGEVARKARLITASDTPTIDSNTPFAYWLSNLFNHLFKIYTSDTIKRLSSSLNDNQDTLKSAPKNLLQDWQKYAPQSLLWVPITSSTGEMLGGIGFFRKAPWLESEAQILAHWQEALCYSISALQSRPRLKRVAKINRNKRRIFLILTILAIVLLFIPVKLSVLAPSEVIAIEPLIIRSPLSGTIDKVHVIPNQVVKKGDILLSLDKTALMTELEIAKQSKVIIETELHQAQQSAFSDREAKSLLALLRLRLEKSHMEVNYLQSLMSRTDIVAQQNGVAIIEDYHKLVGRSVSLGERLLQVAEPTQSQLEIWLPVGDDIPLSVKDDVRFFLASSPDKPLEAKLYTLDHQAQVQAINNQLAYRLTARFANSQKLPRLGQRGTANISSEKVSLGYYIFRRPLAYIRQKIGW